MTQPLHVMKVGLQTKVEARKYGRLILLKESSLNLMFQMAIKYTAFTELQI